MPSMFDQVKEFHEHVDLDVADEPITFEDMWPDGNGDGSFPSRLMILRANLIREEYLELKEAFKAGDLVAIADAICDLHYVLSGTSVSFGIPEDACFAEVQRSNMSKLDRDGNPIRRSDGKVLKGPDFSAPDLRSIIYGS